MSIVYLDSSVALRTILDVPERVRLQTWMDTEGTDFVSSRLLRTEVVRHNAAMAERERRDFHHELTTLRFRPLAEHGSWRGRSDYIPWTGAD